MMPIFPPPLTHRPSFVGSHFVASTGHYLATMAAVQILECGGNAVDAGVAAGLCLNVVQPDRTNIGGVAPIILYSAKDNALWTISGLGYWPASVRREYFVSECDNDIPLGIQRCVVPAAIDSWLTALKQFGTLPLADVAAPAISLAERGFATYYFLRSNIEGVANTLAQWPSSAAVYLPGGHAPDIGERFIQADLANTLNMLVEAEQASLNRGREEAIQTARDRFYKGDIAEQIAQFSSSQNGFLTLEDLNSFSVDVEPSVSINYRGYDIHGCGPWCQGPVVLEALSILQGYNLTQFGHNSADSLHLIIEALKSAFSDREHFYGDPKFVEVPIDGLLDPNYGAAWRERISMSEAFPGMPEPGNPRASASASHDGGYQEPKAFQAEVEPDTSYLCIVDKQGNAFSATPSDGVPGTPIVPGLGFRISGRGQQSWVDDGHPSSIAPGKRPRLTPNPGLIMKEGRVVAPYGTPGGDVQPQAMVQFVVNLIDFRMDPQAAVEAPRLATYSFPQTTHPHPYTPGRVLAEGRIAEDVLSELGQRGHTIERAPGWSARLGALCAVVIDHEHSFLYGAADPRRVAYSIGW